MKTLKDLMTALVDGKTLICVSNIEASLNDSGNLTSPNCNPDEISFRDPKDWSVKPEPLEFWVDVYSDRADGLHDRKEMAMACCKDSLIKTIKVREVTE